MAEAVAKCLTDFGMDIRDCVGQTHDGAANMSGIKNALLLILTVVSQDRLLFGSQHFRDYLPLIAIVQRALFLPYVDHLLS